MKLFTISVSILLCAQISLGAENLDQILAKGDRIAAMNYVQKYRKSEEKKLLPLIANQFFKQKTQELSELALSSWLRDKKEAETKLNEALALEPNNLTLLSMKWVLSIEKKDCKKAEDEIQAWKRFDSIEVIKLHNSQIALCQSKTELEIHSNKSHKIFWQVLEAQSELEKENFEKAKTIVEAAIKTDVGMPETYYLKVKINRALKLPVDEPAKKYLALCRNLTHRQTRDYLLQPFLCQKTREIEGLIK